MPRTKRLRRKDLKQPDEFQTLSRQAIVWASQNAQTLTWVGVGVLVGFIVLALFISFRSARHRDSNTDLASAMSVLRTGDLSAAGRDLAAVADRWPSTSAGRVADLLAANAELRSDRYDSAIPSIQAVLQDRDLRPYLRQELLFALGYAFEEKGDHASAIEQYAACAELPGPYAAPALLAQARLLEGQGDTGKAQALYAEYIQEFPDLPDAEMIRIRHQL